MKRIVLYFFPFTLSLVMCLWTSCSSSSENVETTTVGGDTYSSGCLDTRSGEEGYEEHVPLIVLSKQGDILSGELRNFEYTCAPANTFEVFSKISPSYQGMDTLSVYCEHPKGGLTTRCYCHFNIYFVVRDVKADTLWFKCRVSHGGYESFEGIVTLNTDSSVVIRPRKYLYQRWYLTGYGSDDDFHEIPKENHYYEDYCINLNYDGTMEGNSLCNTIYGTYTFDEQSFRFTTFGGTKEDCVEPAMPFCENLSKVSRYVLDEKGFLRLYYSDSEYLRLINLGW